MKQSRKQKPYKSLYESRDESIEVIFIDKKGVRWILEVGRTWRNRYMEFTMSGHGEGSVGQNIDRIQPSNKAQFSLVNFWEKYHLKEINDKIWKDVLKTISDVKKFEDERRAKESISWDDIDDPKVIALAQHLDMTPEEALNNIEKSSYSDNTYDGAGTDYLVCNDDEATQEARDSMESLFDDIGFIHIRGWENYIDKKRLGKDLASDYTDDREYQKYVEKNPIDYLKEIYGDLSEFSDLEDYIDTEALISYVINADGRGHLLNSYDGKEYSEKVGRDIYYIYET